MGRRGLGAGAGGGMGNSGGGDGGVAGRGQAPGGVGGAGRGGARGAGGASRIGEKVNLKGRAYTWQLATSVAPVPICTLVS